MQIQESFFQERINMFKAAILARTKEVSYLDPDIDQRHRVQSDIIDMSIRLDETETIFKQLREHNRAQS